MKIVKTAFKVVGIVVGLLVVLAIAGYFVVNKPEPQGVPGAEAEQLAMEMVKAVNKEAWDSTRWVKWTFMDMHHFVWNKETHWVKISWEDYEVILNTKDIQNGIAYENGNRVDSDQNKELVEQAWGYFCNDSFWLNPVVKAFDPGTERSVVTTDEGVKKVKVKYNSGGVTPGDAYLWTLDDNYRPVAWQMWVQVLPVNGFKISWDGWVQVPTGAWIYTKHGAFGRQIDMITNLEAGMEFESLGLEENPFVSL